MPGPEERSDVQIANGPEEGSNVMNPEGFRYTRDEMFAIYWAMGDSYHNGVAEVWAVLEPLSQELYEMDVDHGAQKPRHKTIDRRQRGNRKSKAGSNSNDTSYEEELLQELGIDLPTNQSPSSEGEVYEDDSDEEVESFQPLAFAVEGEPDFDSGEPQDGWEYLRRVKYAFLPSVTLLSSFSILRSLRIFLSKLESFGIAESLALELCCQSLGFAACTLNLKRK